MCVSQDRFKKEKGWIRNEQVIGGDERCVYVRTAPQKSGLGVYRL